MFASLENKIIEFIDSSDPAMLCMFCLVLFFVLIGFVAYGIKELFIKKLQYTISRISGARK